MKRHELKNLIQQKGFSLLEILVAIAILAGISLGISNFTDYSITTAITVTNEDIESLQIETAMSRFEWDISHLYSPLYFDIPMNPEQMTPEEGELYNQLADYYQRNARFAFVTFNGHPVPIYRHSEKTELVLFTASNRRKVQDIKQSNFAWVKYELQREEREEDEGIDVPTFALVRKIFASNVYSPEEIDWDQIKTQVLMHKITKIIYEFWNPQTNKWNTNLDVIQNGNHLLRGLRVTLNYLDPTNAPVTSVRVFRPLFPNFLPENVYEFLKAQTNTTGTNGNNGAGINSTNPSSNTGSTSGTGSSEGADEE